MINPVYDGIAGQDSTHHVYSNPNNDNDDIYTFADDYTVYQEPQNYTESNYSLAR